MFNFTLEYKQFLKRLLLLSFPIALQNLITSSLNMVDTIMIGRLGEDALAGVGVANQLFFLFILVSFGINSGTSIFVSQFFGKKDKENIKKIVSFSFVFSLLISLIFAYIAYFNSIWFVSFFSKDEIVLKNASEYLKIIAFTYPITSMSLTYGFAARSISEPNLSLICNAIAFFANTILNYLLIFGIAFLPKLGISGAAIATLIARILEFIILFSYIYSREHLLKWKLKDLISMNKELLTKYLKASIPVIFNESLWALGTVMYSVAYGIVGKKALAAIQIATTVQNLFMVISFGLGHATAIMLGNDLGAKKFKEAVFHCKNLSIIGAILGSAVGIFLMINAFWIVEIFKVSKNLKVEVFKILLMIGLSLGVRTYTTMVIIGVLRSGGDTFYAFILEFGCLWLIGVPLAFLGASVWKLPIYLITLLTYTEEIIKAILCYFRVKSNKWVKNLIEDFN